MPNEVTNNPVNQTQPSMHAQPMPDATSSRKRSREESPPPTRNIVPRVPDYLDAASTSRESLGSTRNVTPGSSDLPTATSATASTAEKSPLFTQNNTQNEEDRQFAASSIGTSSHSIESASPPPEFQEMDTDEYIDHLIHYQIEDADFYGYPLEYKDIARLILGNTRIHNLFVDQEEFGEDTPRLLHEIFSNLSELRRIEGRYLYVDEDVAKLIAEKHTKLEKISMPFRSCVREETIANIIRNNPNMDMFETEIHITDALAILMSQNFKKLLYLDVHCENLTDKGLMALLDGCPDLRDLYIPFLKLEYLTDDVVQKMNAMNLSQLVLDGKANGSARVLELKKRCEFHIDFV